MLKADLFFILCGESSRVRGGEWLPAAVCCGNLAQSQPGIPSLFLWLRGALVTEAQRALGPWLRMLPWPVPSFQIYCLDTTTTTSSTAAKGPGLSVRNIYPGLPGSISPTMGREAGPSLVIRTDLHWQCPCVWDHLVSTCQFSLRHFYIPIYWLFIVLPRKGY